MLSLEESLYRATIQIRDPRCSQFQCPNDVVIHGCKERSFVITNLFPGSIDPPQISDYFLVVFQGMKPMQGAELNGKPQVWDPDQVVERFSECVVLHQLRKIPLLGWSEARKPVLLSNRVISAHANVPKDLSIREIRGT